MQIAVIVLDKAQVVTAIDWARQEGWNPGLGDLAAFLAPDPGGFLGLSVDGELAATISAVSYGPDFAFVGFFICRPDLRGKGLGLKLWNDALARCRARCIGLDGVVAQQGNYAKSGFVLVHRNVRYGGKPARNDAKAAGLRALTQADVPALVAFERRNRLFPAARGSFLAAWLAAPRVAARCIERDGAIAGYGAIRPCFSGFKIGPLFAGNQDDAAALVQALVADTGEGPVFLDVPEPNAAAVALAKSLGLSAVFETARMYRGPAPDLDLAKTFGITSFELG